MSLPEPYYDKDVCACGCNAVVAPGRIFKSGHNLRQLKRTVEHNQRISEAQARAWKTKRARLPLGSTYISTDGYVLVKVVPGKGAWRAEHLLNIEAHIGRNLKKGEVVHHIDGDRQNNSLDNLFLCRDRAHHNEVHRTQDKALRECLRLGLVEFKGGVYNVA